MLIQHNKLNFYRFIEADSLIDDKAFSFIFC
jgi:hypothetical protein